MSTEALDMPLIADAPALDDLLQRLGGARLIALDTEFVRERTYYPELCVLQLATDGVVAAVDCLAGLDLEPLFARLVSPETTWLLHSARQDLEVIFQRTGGRPSALIDTQIAAALLGMPLQIGLQGLLAETLGVAIGKEHTRTDWSRRPLPAAALAYALDDVRFLLPAWRVLEERLTGLGRAAWLDEDCARQLQLPIEPPTDTILERTKGAGALRGKRRSAARRLVAWRETRARQRNKPRRWILADEALVAVAEALPESAAELGKLPGLPSRLVRNSGAALLDAVKGAEPVPEEPESAPPDKAEARRLQAEVRRRAEALGIQPELLATRKDVAQAAAGKRPAAFTSGWRGAVLGDLATLVSRA